MADKKATTYHTVLGAMEFKKKRRAGFNGSKSLTPTRLPEIDFVRLKVGQVGKPLVVSDGEVKFHVVFPLITRKASSYLYNPLTAPN